MVYLPAKATLRATSSPATRVRYMAWQPGEEEVVACAMSKGGRILGMEQSKTGVVNFGTDTDMIYLTWSAAGDLLATAGVEAVIWNSSGIRLATLQSEHPNDDLQPPMKFNVSGRLLVVARRSLHLNGFNVFDALTGRCLQFVEADFRYYSYRPIVWKNELEFFFSSDSTIFEWRFGQERPLQILFGHEATHPIATAITSLAFNSSSGLLAWGGQDRTVRVWNSEEASPSLATLTGHNARVQEVIWHPLSSRVLASFALFGQVILWDTVTKSTLYIFEGIDMPLFSFHFYSSLDRWISFSPDGRHLAIVGQNVVVRRVNSGEIAAVCEVDKAAAVSWSPNGNKLAVKCFDSGSVFNLQNVVEINLKVLSLLQVASCLNIKNGDCDTEEVLKKLDIPKQIISEVRQYLN